MNELSLHNNKWLKIILSAGIMLVLLVIIIGFFYPNDFFFAYLSAFIFWLGLPMGCFALLILHNLSGGEWGETIKQSLAAGTKIIPIMTIFFIPIMFGMSILYVWSNADYVAQNELLQKKQAYLNVPFFIFRAFLYFLLWSIFAYFLTTPKRLFAERTSPLSALGAIIYFLTMTFAAVDWVASLEPEWYSSIFALYIILGQVVMAYGFVILLLCVEALRNEQSQLPPSEMRDLGNLLLAFIVLHAYLAFSQFLIIWNGNQPHEIEWYLHRIEHGWLWWAVVLVLTHFALPFAALLFRTVKHNVQYLMIIVICVLIARIVESVWLILPSQNELSLFSIFLAFILMLGFGGIILSLFVFYCFEKFQKKKLRV